MGIEKEWKKSRRSVVQVDVEVEVESLTFYRQSPMYLSCR